MKIIETEIKNQKLTASKLLALDIVKSSENRLSHRYLTAKKILGARTYANINWEKETADVWDAINPIEREMTNNEQMAYHVLELYKLCDDHTLSCENCFLKIKDLDKCKLGVIDLYDESTVLLTGKTVLIKEEKIKL